MGGANSAKKADPTPTFFFDIGGLGLSGTGEGGGGKGEGIALGGIRTGGIKPQAYQPKGFTKKGLEDKRWASSNKKAGDEYRKKHPGADLSRLHAGDLGSQGGLSLSGTGGFSSRKGDFIPLGGNKKADPKPAVVGSKGNTRVAGGKPPVKQAIVPPTDMRRDFDSPAAMKANNKGQITLMVGGKPRQYSPGDPMAVMDGADVSGQPSWDYLSKR